MSTARVKHLKRHIAAREQAIERRLVAVSALKKSHPVARHHKAEADRLATEVSAIRATVDFHKSAEALSSDIERQQVKVEYLLHALKSARGTKKLQLQRVLKKESLRLREMLAAAKLKSVVPPTVAQDSAAASELPAVALLPEESAAADIAAVAAATGATPGPAPAPAQRQRLLPDAPRDPCISSYRSHERFWSKIPELDFAYSGADGADGDEPWYKNPLVGIGLGLAVGWYIAKKV